MDQQIQYGYIATVPVIEQFADNFVRRIVRSIPYILNIYEGRYLRGIKISPNKKTAGVAVFFNLLRIQQGVCARMHGDGSKHRVRF